MEIILSVRAFDHDREVILSPIKRTSYARRTNVLRTAGTDWTDSQHCGHHHRILHPEVVCDSHGEHLYRNDLACAACDTVHPWVARNEEFGELVYKFARRLGTTPHKMRAVRKGVYEFRATWRSETRCTQMVICGEVTIQLYMLA